jgi:tRNA threonylcarbamoyladenosine biosynthesis protein TsaB
MIIVTIKTDAPQAELRVYDDTTELAIKVWEAHRSLAETIHTQLKTLLEGIDKTLQDVNGVLVYQGPGSFTGLRIGFSVAKTLGFGLAVPVVATQGELWIVDGVRRILASDTHTDALPYYGAPVHITTPKK